MMNDDDDDAFQVVLSLWGERVWCVLERNLTGVGHAKRGDARGGGDSALPFPVLCGTKKREREREIEKETFKCPSF